MTLLTLVWALASAAPGTAVQVVACDSPGVDSWLVDFRDRVVRFNGLASFATGVWGEPIACEGESTAEFDGASYGILRLDFDGGVTLEVETQPIETSIVRLWRPDGFPDPSAVEAALRAYVTGVGVSIDWGRSERSVEGDRSLETYWDPDPGMNASAVLIRSGDTLVEVRFSMAL